MTIEPRPQTRSETCTSSASQRLERASGFHQGQRSEPTAPKAGHKTANPIMHHEQISSCQAGGRPHKSKSSNPERTTPNHWLRVVFALALWEKAEPGLLENGTGLWPL